MGSTTSKFTTKTKPLKALHFAATHCYPNDNVNNELDETYEKGDYGNLNYGKLFVNQMNNIQWYMYEQIELDIKIKSIKM